MRHESKPAPHRPPLLGPCTPMALIARWWAFWLLPYCLGPMPTSTGTRPARAPPASNVVSVDFRSRRVVGRGRGDPRQPIRL